ncbi:MAG: ABC transporter ATP-binding protein [Pseudomonadota bacterium]
MTRLTADKVSITLGGQLIVDRADAVVGPSCVTGIIGPNGAGKTTLLRALCGLQTVDSGAIAVDGAPLGGISAGERARRIAYLAQDRVVVWAMPVAAVVALGRLPHGETGLLTPQGRDVVDDVMERCDLADLADRRVTTLSGGERARVVIARALAVQAPVLLTDEPIAGLDPAHALDVMALLRREAARGVAVAVVLHDLTLAARFCDRLVLMAGGSVVGDGPPAATLTDAALREHYGIVAHRDHVGDAPVIVPMARVPQDP